MEVRSVQDSGTMPLISEILLAVSVGCVEIKPTCASQEEDEMDSYQVFSSLIHSLPTASLFASLCIALVH